MYKGPLSLKIYFKLMVIKISLSNQLASAI